MFAAQEIQVSTNKKPTKLRTDNQMRFPYKFIPRYWVHIWIRYPNVHTTKFESSTLFYFVRYISSGISIFHVVYCDGLYFDCVTAELQNTDKSLCRRNSSIVEFIYEFRRHDGAQHVGKTLLWLFMKFMIIHRVELSLGDGRGISNCLINLFRIY